MGNDKWLRGWDFALAEVMGRVCVASGRVSLRGSLSIGTKMFKGRQDDVFVWPLM